jgi:AraC-like DNA-binding protein
MSKTNEAIRIAKERGYTVNEAGELFNPQGIQMKLTQKAYSNKERKYEHFTVNRTLIPFHRFIAYLKFGEEALHEGIVTRHLNDNSLDNNWSNIAIGTRSDNFKDAVENGAIQKRSEKAFILNDLKKQLLFQLLKEGLTQIQIAQELGVSRSTIQRAIKRHR